MTKEMYRPPSEKLPQFWGRVPVGKLPFPIRARFPVMVLTGAIAKEEWIPCTLVEKDLAGNKVIEFSHEDRVPEKYRGKFMALHVSQKLEVFF